jgi:predicted PurR-regulated permease PerM
MGIELALFWGVMAIILSYIPYIGLFIVAVPAVILAWLQLGIWGALVAIAGICIINAVVENVVFSKFAEKSFNMPPLVVIVSLVLWTWVLGTIGMLISVPFTIMIIIALKYHESTKWIPVILGMDDLKEK